MKSMTLEEVEALREKLLIKEREKAIKKFNEKEKKIFNYILKATRDTNKLNFSKEPVKVIKYDAKTTKIIDVINKNDFGCQDSAVRELIGVCINVKIPPKKDESTGFNFKFKGAFIQPIRNFSSHDYFLDEPALQIDRESGLFRLKFGDNGNNLGGKVKFFEPVSDEKVVKYFIKYKDIIMTKLSSII